MCVLYDGLIAGGVEEIEVGVGDEAGEGENGVTFEVETGHFAVNPDEGVAGAGFGHAGGSWGCVSYARLRRRGRIKGWQIILGLTRQENTGEKPGAQSSG